ncbi:TetR/AcrR family transcriptional regulator [Actinoplanes flavus]|uniref:TetR family transcriptional regulator n=1 Tax=Actinoplanes flavus TaxID=2820290 RepID=A0ABS3UIK4_9ACTN|nr:TetR family transcriptional regulator [Actinoplanes flavus]MBO3738614.1 TetR family transcriptional regulator [Actinoplanes flavus]
MGLRDEKKQATRTAIADAALALFLANGFDRVTVAEVAKAARVSVNTVFNYFPTKEDLFFDRQTEVVRRLARAAADRSPGESAVAAVRRAFLDAIHRDEPTLGMSTGMIAFWRAVDDSPALQARARLLSELTEAALAGELADQSPPDTDPATPRILAAVISGVDRALHAEIRRRITLGEDPEIVRAALEAAADRAYTAVSTGWDPLTT